jgi:hypothetical protein
MPAMSGRNRPRPGDTVVLTEVPLGLFDGLPIEEQQAYLRWSESQCG